MRQKRNLQTPIRKAKTPIYCRFPVPFLKNLQCKILFLQCRFLLFLEKSAVQILFFRSANFPLDLHCKFLVLAVQIVCPCGGRVRPRQTDTHDPWRRQDTNTTETRPENSTRNFRQAGIHGKSKNRSFPRPPSTRPPCLGS